MEPSIEPVSEIRGVATSRIAGFWRRLGALVVDALVLGAIGFPLGLLLGERIAPVGTPARLIGLLVIVPYLGVLGSRVGKGQTLGKRWLGLRVVDANGQPLALPRSFIRATMLALPWIFNGIRFGSLGPVVLVTLWVAGILVFGVGGAIIGTYMLNRRTRQAFHDLVARSYVIQSEDVGLHAPAASTRKPMMASLAWIGLVASVSTAMVAMAPHRLAKDLPPLLTESVLAIPGASSFEIRHVTTWGAGHSSTELVVVLWYRGPQEAMKHAARQVVAAMLQHHPDAATTPSLGVTVVRGWDVGVAQLTGARTFVQTPAHWRAELEP
jgi:uncharacterized RDD family membrane protein YckC